MEDRQCIWGFVRVLGWKTGSVCGDLLGWKTGSVCGYLLGC